MNLVVPIITGTIAGALSGLLGIGGGIVLVPLLLYLFRMSSAEAAGTSLAIVIPTAIVGVATHLTKGNVNLKAAALIAVGSMVGAAFGARLASVLPDVTVKRLFAVLLIFVAFRLLYDTTAPRRGGDNEKRPVAARSQG